MQQPPPPLSEDESPASDERASDDESVDSLSTPPIDYRSAMHNRTIACSVWVSKRNETRSQCAVNHMSSQPPTIISRMFSMGDWTSLVRFLLLPCIDRAH